MIMQLLNVKIGMTFSGGLLDFILLGVIPNRTRWWLVILVGLGFAVIYYFLFRFFIRKFDLKTPGREDDDIFDDMHNETVNDDLAAEILIALGGAGNINKLDACITRLRVTVNDSSKVNKERLKELGAAGVMQVGENIQAIFGGKSDILKTQIREIMNGMGEK